MVDSPGPGTPEVQDALRLKLNWHDGGSEGPGQMRAVIAACFAIAAGAARHVLVYRTVTESTAQGEGGRQGIGGSGGGSGGVPRFGGFLQWSLPFGAVSAVNWIALVGQRRVHEFGLTREQLAHVALNGRRNAALNPKAIYREPMTLDDYMAARMISSPAVPVRLRCPLRRIDGVGRLPRRTTPRTRRIPPAMSTPWAPPCGGVPVGTSSTT